MNGSDPFYLASSSACHGCERAAHHGLQCASMARRSLQVQITSPVLCAIGCDSVKHISFGSSSGDAPFVSAISDLSLPSTRCGRSRRRKLWLLPSEKCTYEERRILSINVCTYDCLSLPSVLSHRRIVSQRAS